MHYQKISNALINRTDVIGDGRKLNFEHVQNFATEKYVAIAVHPGTPRSYLRIGYSWIHHGHIIRFITVGLPASQTVKGRQ